MTDHRPIVHSSVSIEAWEAENLHAIAHTAGAALEGLLTQWPDVDLASIQVTRDNHRGGQDNRIHITARRGLTHPSPTPPHTPPPPRMMCRYPAPHVPHVWDEGGNDYTCPGWNS